MGTLIKYSTTSFYIMIAKHDGYAELNLKDDNPGWQKAEPVEKVYVKYYPKNNLTTHEDTLPNQI